MVQSINNDESAVTKQKIVIDLSTKDLTTDSTSGVITLVREETENTNEKRILVWYDSNGKDTSTRSKSEYDFVIEQINGIITLQEKGKEAFVIGKDLAIAPITGATAAVTYPTAWNCMTDSSWAVFQNLAISTVISILISVYFAPASIAASLAALGVGVAQMFYKKQYCSRVLSALEQERYFVYYWYSDAGYKNLVGQYTTSKEIIYLG